MKMIRWFSLLAALGLGLCVFAAALGAWQLLKGVEGLAAGLSAFALGMGGACIPMSLRALVKSIKLDSQTTP